MMRMTRMMVAAVALGLTLGLGGCKQDDDGEDHAGSHDIKAKNGGTIVHLEDHGPCMEVVYDAKAGTLKLYMVDAHGDALELEEAPTANIEKDATVVKATGSKSMWTFTHDNLKEHPHVEFVIKVGDKTFNSDKWHADEDDH